MRDLLLQPPHVAAELRAKPVEDLLIDGDPLPLHVDQHLDQRHLDVTKKRLDLQSLERGGEVVSEREDGCAVIAAVRRGLRHTDLGEGDFGSPPPRHILVGSHRTTEMLETEHVDRVGAAPGLEYEAGQHRVVGDAAKLHSRRAQHLPVVLDVMTGLGDSRVLEQLAERCRGRRRQRRQILHTGPRCLGAGEVELSARRVPMRERDVPDLRGARGEREPHEVGIVGLPRGSLGVERDDRSLA